ncbi:MAG: alpha/beta hydrolase [Bacteroidota bacterium]
MGSKQGWNPRNFSIIISLIYIFLGCCTPSFAQETLPFPNSQFADISGLRIHYRQWKTENESKGHILLIHGFCGSTISWRNNVLPLLQAGWNLLAVDMPPYGYSDRAALINHSPSLQADLLWALTDQLSPGKDTWHLIGHSLGGAVAGAMAARRPSQSSSVIIIDGIMRHVGSGAKPVYRHILGSRLAKFLAEVAAVFHFFRPATVKNILGKAYGRRPTTEEVHAYLEPLKMPRTASGIFDMAAYASATFEYAEVDVHCPVLIIWGENDPWLPLLAGQKMHNLLPQSILHIIPTAAHCPMETHADACHQLMLPFLEHPH